MISNADEETAARIDNELAEPLDPREAAAQKKVAAALSNLAALR